MTAKIKTNELINHNIENIDKLKNILKDLPLDKYNKNQAKSIDHLYSELKNKECIMQKEKVDNKSVWVRIANGVGITLYYNLYNKPLFLQETMQIFKANQVRYRSMNTSIAEKLMGNENIEKAVVRCFREELDLDINIELQEAIKTESFSESESYPGTYRRYIMYNWNVYLPKKYYQYEYIEKQKDKDNYWHWRGIPVGMSVPEFNAKIN